MFLLLVYTGTKNVYVRSEVPVTYGIRYQFQNQIRIKFVSRIWISIRNSDPHSKFLHNFTCSPRFFPKTEACDKSAPVL